MPKREGSGDKGWTGPHQGACRRWTATIPEEKIVQTVLSRDGTRIAYEQSGEGPAVILVVGAFNLRATGAPLAEALDDRFTVFNYDRRGRGDSSDTSPYAIEREIEDLGSLIDQAGGSACVFGYSSGAILAVRAAAHGLPISRLALYEPPPTGARAGTLAPQLAELISEGRRGDAVELFQTDGVGIPPAVVAQLRNAPFRPALEAMAQTLVYESTILQAVPAGVLDAVRVPTLVIDGGESLEVMRQAARSLAETLPDAAYRSLDGQGHDIDPAVLGPMLVEFFGPTD
jgi:pimeloyl-ACP methyl ester carboxylesterase